MKLNDKLTIPEQVMARQVGDETVILDLENGTYFGLDPVGARVWQLIGDGKNLGDICAIIVTEFDVSRDIVERDVLDLTDDLHAKKLISISTK